ncbi:alpha/beta fold hydrolase, partial [Paracoccus sp. (in: a-proteobacteria)]|uniref:alpha/beta fold hydrolase n=1 Tax=Paracoccus sp. TaxID=267 RepID=UPI003A88C7CD
MSGVRMRHWPGNPERPGLALHCMLASGSYWAGIAGRLDGRIDLRAFDLPGHGQSDDWSPAPDGPDYHTAVTRIAASFIDRPVDLIGHSLGGTVALRLAVAAPEAIRSLTLIEPVLFAAARDDEQRALHEQMGELIAAGHSDQAARVFMAIWGAQGYDDLPPRMQQHMRDRISLIAENSPALSDDRANILRPGGLESITAPVLIISGQDSPPVVHAIAEALAARLPDVGRASVPGARHMLPITHADQVAG